MPILGPIRALPGACRAWDPLQGYTLPNKVYGTLSLMNQLRIIAPKRACLHNFKETQNTEEETKFRRFQRNSVEVGFEVEL